MKFPMKLHWPAPWGMTYHVADPEDRNSEAEHRQPWRLAGIAVGALGLGALVAQVWSQALVAPSAAPLASQPPAAVASAPSPASADIFSTRTWEPPPPPPPPPPAATPAPPAPPPKPEPPPLPFRYLGRMGEAGRPTVIFLAYGSDVLAVKRGDRIPGGYRVGELRDGQLRFEYQPLKAEQFLPVGSP